MSSGPERPAAAPGMDESYDTVVVPHLDAAYRLARWLMRDEHDAEDVVQEASLRALRYFRTFVGGDGRAWFLRIVRNTCYGWRRHGYQPATDPFDEEQHSSTGTPRDPETLLLQTDDAMSIARALSSLPDHFHQLLVLRELEGLSYRELSEVIGIPMGTVMSRLSRARDALRTALDARRLPPGMSPGTDAREQEADAVVVRTAWTRKAREATVEASAFRSAAVAPTSHAGRDRMKNYVTTLAIALTLALPQAAKAQGVTPGCAAMVSVVSPNAPAQVARRSSTAVAIGFSPLAVTLDVNPDVLTLWPVKRARAATLLAVRPHKSLQPPASTQRGGRGRSKKRIVAGAIVGSVGGFFAGGFLGAHIEGDRCDCDDPGVRGFLIGAPIGALAGGIFGARFLF